VLHNLFGNAMRYCNSNGKIVLAARRLREGDDSVEISVRNTGPQIPEDIRGNLFGKYVRGKGGRRGMGLYFCRLVAEAHGGTIACEPHAEGPSFVLRLPGRA
jgi:signal transduction histidine kinase